MIRDWTPGDGRVRSRDWKPEEVGGIEYRLAETQWIATCLASMQRGRLMTHGYTTHSQWWSDGYEHKRRQELNQYQEAKLPIRCLMTFLVARQTRT